jgi:hypothetical protein
MDGGKEGDAIFLTAEEIATLTKTRLRHRQIIFLQRHGIFHYLDSAGSPIVTRAAIDEFERWS